MTPPKPFDLFVDEVIEQNIELWLEDRRTKEVAKDL